MYRIICSFLLMLLELLFRELDLVIIHLFIMLV
nr:MAG TPA: hypothetical protein [Caudoviricetes sp.]